MAKDYTKGLALLAWRVERYVTKYNLNSATGAPVGWDSAHQAAAEQMRAGAAIIDADTKFRQQP